MKQNEFYIGWQDKMPEQHKSFLRSFLIPLFLLLPFLVIGVVWLQKPFNQHQFEFGTLKKITGTYYVTPVPMLLADAGQLPDGMANSILLVGFGKFGAEGIMEKIAAEEGDLQEKKITLEGTLIYGDGKAMLELTNEAGAFVQIEKSTPQAVASLANPTSISLKGEILDPKCYFGVMKPGEGKIHKSCAIRCISGGIPPVFRAETGDSNAPYRYYLMADMEGNPINQKILPYVAEPLSMKGTTNRFLDWDIFYVNLEQLPVQTMRLSELCRGQSTSAL